MTDRIDLDEVADEAAEPGEGESRGDWLWADEGAPAGEPPPGDDGAEHEGGTGPTDGRDLADAAPEAPGGVDGPRHRPAPHVPRANKDRPVGIPVEGGGADGGRQPETPVDTAGEGATGPHGGDADDMTLAFTYGAATRLDEPQQAFADAERWADWVGIVGDVEAHVINKFQRDRGVDVDFFNGTGTGPGQRLADVDERSMFFAERLVVVGVEGRDEPIAEEAGWEFVPLATAAEEADWALVE